MNSYTCNECLDKDICAKLNGYFHPPKDLITYNFKICEKFPSVLNKLKGNGEQSASCDNCNNFGNKHKCWSMSKNFICDRWEKKYDNRRNG